jgi:outer membrane protein assembly factor BamB
LLAVDGNTLTVQTGSGTSLAEIDVNTGTVAWEHDTGRPLLKVQPIEAKGRVLVLTRAADATDLERRIEAVSADTGDSVWSEQNADNTFVVNGDDVVVAADLGGNWSAFDIATGSTHWSRYGDGSTILAVSGKFAVTDGLSVFDLETGEHAWGTSKFQTSGDVHVVGDVVLANSVSHEPTAYDLATGKKLWALADGFVVTVLDESATVLTENVDVLELHDLHTGAVLWTLTVGDKIGVSAETDADGNLYVFLGKYQKRLATIVAIKPPAA